MSASISLPDLLAKVWTQHCQREFAFWMLVVQRAASLALENPIDISIELPDYDRRIWITPDSKIEPDPLAEDELTKEQKAAALKLKAELDELTQQIADGKKSPVRWGYAEADLSLLDTLRYLPIRLQFELANGIVESEQRSAGDYYAERGAWDYAVQEFLKATQIPHCTEDMLGLYCEQVSRGDLQQSSPFSAQIAQLEREGFTQQLLDGLKEQYPDVLEEIGSLKQRGIGFKLPQRSEPIFKKRSTEQGEARTKIIAALTMHHNYENGSCLILEPIGVGELARKADVGKATVSVFFKKEFGAHTVYRAACRNAALLAHSIRLLRGEYTPSILFNRIPDENGDNDADE